METQETTNIPPPADNPTTRPNLTQSSCLPAHTTMPEALETTKRKFYKLLDNFSSSRVSLAPESVYSVPSAASTSTTTLAEPANKRPRFSLSSRTSDDAGRPRSLSRPVSMPTAGGLRAVTPEQTEGESPRTSLEGKREFVPRDELKRLVEERRVRKAAEEAKRRSQTPFKYAPWSHDLFLERLKTFSDIKIWTPKPEALSEVAWAKRGWICQGGPASKDAVFCRMCEKRVTVMLKREKKEGDASIAGAKVEPVKWWQEEAQRALVARYQKLIVEGHDETCLWRGHGCKDDIYRMKMADPNIWQPDLRRRYQSLAAFAFSLPKNLTLPSSISEPAIHFDLPRMTAGLSTLLQEDPLPGPENLPLTTGENAAALSILSSTDTPITIDPTALAMSIYGWSGTKTSGVHLAHCTTCFQRCGLWLYNGQPPKSRPSLPSTTTTTMPLAFNPLTLHREYCPWRNPHSQSAEGSFQGLSGWEILTSLIQFVVERQERKVKTQEIERMEADGVDVFEEKSWDEVMAHDREMEGRIAKIRRAFGTLKKKRPGTAVAGGQGDREKRSSIGGGLRASLGGRPKSAA